MTARGACPTAREIPKNRQRKANSKRDKSIEDLEEVGKDSKSDTLKESVAKSKAETMPKSETKATTKPKAQPTSTPKLFRGGRNGVDWEVSDRVVRKRQRQWQWHCIRRWQLATHPHQFAAEEQQKLNEKAVENQAEDEVVGVTARKFSREVLQWTSRDNQ